MVVPSLAGEPFCNASPLPPLRSHMQITIPHHHHHLGNYRPISPCFCAPLTAQTPKIVGRRGRLKLSECLGWAAAAADPEVAIPLQLRHLGRTKTHAFIRTVRESGICPQSDAGHCRTHTEAHCSESFLRFRPIAINPGKVMKKAAKK